MTSQKRLGFIGIIIDDRKTAAEPINSILSEHGDLILSRTGLPHLKNEKSVITLVVEITAYELDKLKELLSNIEGVDVKSVLA